MAIAIVLAHGLSPHSCHDTLGEVFVPRQPIANMIARVEKEVIIDTTNLHGLPCSYCQQS
jgi:hypothetical protein